MIFPIERLQELCQEGRLGGLTPNFFSFLGYNMDPEKVQATVARGIALCVVRIGEKLQPALSTSWSVRC